MLVLVFIVSFFSMQCCFYVNRKHNSVHSPKLHGRCTSFITFCICGISVWFLFYTCISFPEKTQAKTPKCGYWQCLLMYLYFHLYFIFILHARENTSIRLNKVFDDVYWIICIFFCIWIWISRPQKTQAETAKRNDPEI